MLCDVVVVVVCGCRFGFGEVFFGDGDFEVGKAGVAEFLTESDNGGVTYMGGFFYVGHGGVDDFLPD